MINDSVTTFLSRFRLRHIFLVLLTIVVSSSCSMRSTTIQTEIIVQNAENIVIPEPDITDEEPEIIVEYPGPVEVSNPEPEEVSNPGLLEVSNPEPEEVSNPGLLEVSNPEPEEVSNPGLLEVSNPESEEVGNPGLLEVSNPEPEEVSNPGPVEVSNPELLEVSNPELLEVSNPEPVEVSNPELLEVSNPINAATDNSSVADHRFYSRYSKKLGIRLDGTENKALIRSIGRWLRVPFKWGGCSKRGVDCSCFVKLVYKDVYGISLNRTSRNIVHKNLNSVEKRELREGDIISFKIGGDRISHIGIYLKDNKFAHVSRSKGVRISSLTRKYYRERFFSAGRVKRGFKRVYVAKKTSKPPAPAPNLEQTVKLGELTVHETIDSNVITVSTSM
ncbi:NlpC/P60 family protein [Desulfobacterales bacterium HSG2]|nr:NlpC/P60 family protein [Desulfobacterales bacterium HSG2]